MFDFEKVCKDNRILYLFGFCVGYILMLLFPTIVTLSVSSIYSNTHGSLEGTTTTSLSLIGQAISYVPLSILFIFFLRSAFIENFQSFKQKWYSNVIIVLVGVGAMMFFSYAPIINKLYQLMGITGTSTNQENIVDALTNGGLFFGLIGAGILAPIIEEVVFRKFLFDTVEKSFKWHKVFSIIISTLVFSLIHMSSEILGIISGTLEIKELLKIFLYIPLALIISLSYSLSKNNIYVAILIHAINNIIAILVIVL